MYSSIYPSIQLFIQFCWFHTKKFEQTYFAVNYYAYVCMYMCKFLYIQLLQLNSCRKVKILTDKTFKIIKQKKNNIK